VRLTWPRPTTLRWQIQLLVGGLLLLLLVTGITAAIVAARLADTRNMLTTLLRPAQVAAVALSQAYVDQETGEREYLLTANAAELTQYNAGLADAARLRALLGKNLAGDPTSVMLLAGVDRAATAWHQGTSEPEINLRQAGVLTTGELLARAPDDERLFSTLREALTSLQNRTNQLVAAQVQNANTTQSIVNEIAIAATAAAVVLTAVATVVLRRSLALPLNRLVSQVGRVGHDLGHSVDVTGPREITTVAAAVDAMRVRLRTEMARATAHQQQLARYEEAERIARDLNETVVQQLFRTGLDLQSMASRQPAAANALSVAVDNIDNAIRELQTAIFGLTVRPSEDGLSKRVLDVVAESETILGSSPQVRFDGTLTGNLPTPVSDELIKTLRRVLSDLATESRAPEVSIQIELTNGLLRLTVADGKDTTTVDWTV